FSVSLVERGARVSIIDLQRRPARSTPDFEQHCADGNITVDIADITKRDEIEKTLDLITSRWHVPDILINNAAIDSPPNAPAEENGPFESYPENSLDRIIDVNLKGTFLCCQVIGGAMARRGKGSIINIASIYGMVSPNQDIYEYKRKSGRDWYKPAAYAVTKSAILNLTRYLATYWAKKGVRVNTLSPAGVFNEQDEEFLKEYQKRIPIGRMAKPDELNGAIIFLASDASSYMTGANLVVDGGWTSW
ncbi:MAG TPA: SDR family oxidoreductase, partial [Bacteroidota bacterium]|nr:SDR family oxidoreductase [Bacteroidota bacterium]